MKNKISEEQRRRLDDEIKVEVLETLRAICLYIEGEVYKKDIRQSNLNKYELHMSGHSSTLRELADNLRDMYSRDDTEG